jgi:hypothetical protein
MDAPTTATLLPGYCGLSAVARAERLIFVLTADLHWFFDDSGSEPSTPVFVLAGFLSTAAEWARFSDEWRAALDVHPKLDYFKMAEAHSLRRQFSRDRGWDDLTRDTRVRKLVHIIRQRVKLRISASIRHAHFDKYLRSLPAVGRSLGTDNPYPVLFSHLMAEEMVFAFRNGFPQKHDIVLDEQTGMEEVIQELWPQFRAAVIERKRPDLLNLIGSRPYFLDDKDFLPLQAADLYAWHVRDHIQRGGQEPGRVLRMLRSVRSHHVALTEAKLAKDNQRLLAQGEVLKQSNPLLQLVHFPMTKREQRKARSAHSKARGVKLSRRGQPS